jgi:ADP-heptose:LPS heptosyltransferase
VKRILIYRPGALGDTIVAVPAIQALRRTYPDAKLALMTVHMDTGIWADQVLREFAWFDEVITYAPGDLRRPGSIGALWRRVRRFGADTVVHLSSEQNSPARILRDRAFFALAGIPGFVGGAAASVTWYGRRRRDDRLYPFEVDRLLAFAVKAGAEPGRAPVFDLPIGDDARARVDALLGEPAFERGRMLIGLCPGSKQPAKRWPVERYGQVGRRLIDAYDASIVVVGGEQRDAVVLRDAEAVRVPLAELVLRARVALVRGVAVQRDGSRLVLRDAAAGAVRPSEVALRRGVALRGRLAEPLDRE